MKFFLSLILIALLSYALGLFLPWWTIAIAAFLVSAFIPQKPLTSFLTGFLSLFLFWGIMSWYISFANHDILANRISLLIFKTESSWLLVLLTALIGALVAGLAALAGSFAHGKVRAPR